MSTYQRETPHANGSLAAARTQSHWRSVRALAITVAAVIGVFVLAAIVR